MASVSVRCALQRAISPCVRHRGFMSTMSVASPEEESHFLLILGKPGGGKGTISKKILHVSTGCHCLAPDVHSESDTVVDSLSLGLSQAASCFDGGLASPTRS